MRIPMNADINANALALLATDGASREARLEAARVVGAFALDLAVFIEALVTDVHDHPTAERLLDHAERVLDPLDRLRLTVALAAVPPEAGADTVLLLAAGRIKRPAGRENDRDACLAMGIMVLGRVAPDVGLAVAAAWLRLQPRLDSPVARAISKVSAELVALGPEPDVLELLEIYAPSVESCCARARIATC